MKFTRYKIKECCGGSSTSLKLDSYISTHLISYLTNFGFKESEHFTKNGIMYIQNKSVILSGAFGANTLSVKCKSSDCADQLDELEKILANMP